MSQLRVLAFHGAGESAESFAATLSPITRALGPVDFQARPASAHPDLTDRLHYAGVGALRFSHRCWDLPTLADDVRQWDGGRTLLLGYSMGAITAMRLFALVPDLVAGVVCIAGCFSLMQAFGEPYRPPAGCGSHARFLFIHGTEDRTIPASYSHECAEALRAEGFSVAYRLVQGAGHDLGQLGLSGQSCASAALIDWLRAFIGASPSPEARPRC